MNRPTKRFLALVGSALIGAFGAVALATPAQAHHPIIVGKAECQADGQYKIEWKVSNGDWGNPKVKLLEVQATPSTSVSNITVGVWLDKNQSVTGIQFVPGTTTLAKLRVKGQWYKANGDATNIIEERTGEVKMPGTCVAPAPPTVAGESTCDKFTVKVTNPKAAQPVEATVTYGTQEEKFTVQPGETKPVVFDASSTTEATVKFTGSDQLHKVKFEKPANCAGLPQTGASTGTYVASGTGLAALGVLVFFLARRRQVRLRRMAAM